MTRPLVPSIPIQPGSADISGEDIAEFMDLSEFWRALFYLEDKAYARTILSKVQEDPGKGNQHFIPQVLLKAMRGFPAGSVLWEADLTDTICRPKNPSNTGHLGPTYYDFESNDGNTLSLEKVWTITESKIRPILEKADAGHDLNTADVLLLDRFIGQMIVRVPAWIEGLRAHAEDAGYLTGDWHEGELEATMISVSEDFKNLLSLDFDWEVYRLSDDAVENGQPGFVLSDKPVQVRQRWFDKEDVPDGAGPGPEAEGGAGLDLRFACPLGWRTVAVARLASDYKAGYKRTSDAAPDFVKTINASAVSRSQFVYGRKADVTLATGLPAGP